jgi:hypothetical protein
MIAHPRARIVGLVLLALVGLAVAVALSIAASNLTSQPIGLSGEPLREGQTLAPAVRAQRTQPRHVPRPQPSRTVTMTTTTTATAPAPSGSTESERGDD